MDSLTISFPDTICRDGWHSNSAGPGTCSHHGGVLSYESSNDNSDMAVVPPLIIWTLIWLTILWWWKR